MSGSTLKIGEEVEGTRLTPLRYSHSTEGGGAYYIYRCRCGTEKPMRKNNVSGKRNKTRSCGCRKKEWLLEWKVILKEIRKGQEPWNKGNHRRCSPLGRTPWNKGKMKITHQDGSSEYISIKAELPPDTGGQSLPGEKPR